MLFRWFSPLLILCFLVACGGPKEDPRLVAERFFALCATGKAAEAYAQSADAFRLKRTEKYFTTRVHELQLDKAPKLEWSATEERGNQRRIPLEVTIASGLTIPIAVHLIQERGQWRVLTVKRNLPGDGDVDIFEVSARSEDNRIESTRNFVEPIAPALPSDASLQRLIQQTLMDFNEAIQKGDFGPFYETVSDRWRYRGKDPSKLSYIGNDPRRLAEADPQNRAGRLTIEALRRSFQPFVDARVDLSSLQGQTAILEPAPILNTDGVLIVKGRYEKYIFLGGLPPKPQKMDFQLEYVLEGTAWRLYGITVNVRQP